MLLRQHISLNLLTFGAEKGPSFNSRPRLKNKNHFIAFLKSDFLKKQQRSGQGKFMGIRVRPGQRPVLRSYVIKKFISVTLVIRESSLATRRGQIQHGRQNT